MFIIIKYDLSKIPIEEGGCLCLRTWTLVKFKVFIPTLLLLHMRWTD